MASMSTSDIEIVDFSVVDGISKRKPITLRSVLNFYLSFIY